MFKLSKTDFAKYNSMTKYPSILTYHKSGERGTLQEEVQVSFTTKELFVTEKIDGVNARIIVNPDNTVVVGSREELLWEADDIIQNPVYGIVNTLQTQAIYMKKNNYRDFHMPRQDAIMVFYCEVYGQKAMNGWKQYSDNDKMSFRLFDMCIIPNLDKMFNLSIAGVASWRDNNNQDFVSMEILRSLCKKQKTAGLEPVPFIDAPPLPTTVDDTYSWLIGLQGKSSLASDSVEGKPEGVIVRTKDRSQIAKIRREDYERTFRNRNIRF